VSDGPLSSQATFIRGRKSRATPTRIGEAHAPSPRARSSCKEPGAYYGHFDEVVPENPHGLVPADEVHDAIEQLRRRGLDAQGIARAAGISLDSAYRATAGNGQMRRATRDAIRAAANGDPDEA
jgi:hypothetical protein